MDDTKFPTYQISKFHGTDRQLQSVFRTNSKEEYENQLKEWSEVTPKKEVRVSVDEYQINHTCPVHGVPMNERESKTKTDNEGNPVKYFAHGTTVNGKFKLCFGK